MTASSPATITDASRQLAAAIDALDYSRFRVLPDYIDANGHMNVGYYGVIFDTASDLPCAALDIGFPMISRHKLTIFTIESHLTFQREILEGRPLNFTFQMLDFDAKRMHFFMTMRDADSAEISATQEVMSMCIDMATRRSTSWPPDAMEKLTLLSAVHSTRPRPPEAGRVIGIRRKAGA